jgi:hypothetical protein
MSTGLVRLHTQRKRFSGSILIHRFFTGLSTVNPVAGAILNTHVEETGGQVFTFGANPIRSRG